MKILQINTVYGVKSTGRTCAEVEKALLAQGHECVTAYGNGPKSNSAHTYRIDTRLEYQVHNIMSRITGLEGYFSWFATARFIHFIQKYQPDVIHLRNLHGHYLCLPLFFSYLKKSRIPVIQNLHDCWIYTGGCTHYTAIGCYKWLSECNHCPKYKEYPVSWFFDFSKKLRRDKEKWYSGIENLTLIGVSQWVTEEGKRSFLGKAKEVRCIYNWINQDVFKSYHDIRDTIREKYGIPKDKFMIIGVSAGWSAGTPRFDDFMEIADRLKDDEILVMVGQSNEDLNRKGRLIHIPYISDTTELAKLYNSADVYVHCSVEDTFGKVIAEAMACGTPVIVYDATGCKELVAEGCGYKVEPRNIQQIMEKCRLVKTNKREFYTDNCIQRVQNDFNYTKNVETLIRVYENLSRKSFHGSL